MDGTYENWVAPAAADCVNLRLFNMMSIWIGGIWTDIGSADTTAFNLDVDVAVSLLLGSVVDDFKLIPFLGILYATLQISFTA
jgi:hypothetical protein